MSYTNGLDNPELYHQTKIYSGDGNDDRNIIFDVTDTTMRPDWLWSARRDSGDNLSIYDSVRGDGKELRSAQNGSQLDRTNNIQALQSNGFQVGDDGQVNASGGTYVSWGWSAGGSTPAITYTVKVVSDSGNKYRFDDYGTSAVTLDLQEGGTYTFDLSDSSNDGHPMKFSTTSNGSHGGGSTYSTGVVYQLDGASVTEANYYNTSNFNSASSRKIIITVSASAPTLYYFCHYHSGMGGQANTNSTFGSSNFAGSIQSTVSANITAGFSVVKWTGDNSSTATIGHSLGGAIPNLIIVKRIDATDNWYVYSKPLGNTKVLNLDLSSASSSSINYWNNTDPTTSVFTVGDSFRTTGSFIAYCFVEKKGYSKISSYTGFSDSNGPVVITGFSPSWVIFKPDASADWTIVDAKRNTFNPVKDKTLNANLNSAEHDGSADLDFLSNGFKIRNANSDTNNSGKIIYMAFAESPFVNSKGVPTNAR